MGLKGLEGVYERANRDDSVWKAIEIFWTFEQGVRKIQSITSFVDDDDEFDAIAVVEACCLRNLRSQDPVAWYEGYLLESEALEKRAKFGKRKFLKMSFEMGLLTSIDVNEFGRSMTYPRVLARGSNGE